MKLKDWIIIILILLNKFKIIIMPYDIGAGAAQAAVNTGQGLLGSAFGMLTAGINDRRQLRQQEKLQELQLKGNKEMAMFNYEQQMKMWNDTNYKAQVEQLRKAGLNPALLYGMSGGGGQTVNAAQGQGASGGQAPQGGGEITNTMGMMLQAQLMQAQKENIEADTANKQADTANKPLTGANIQASTALITQGLSNAKAIEAGQKLDNILKEFQTQVAGTTINEQIDSVTANYRKAEHELQIIINNESVSTQTLDDQVEQIKAEALGALIRNDQMKSGIQLNDAQIKKMAADIQNAVRGLQINEKGVNIQERYLEIEQKIRNLTDKDKITIETVKGIVQVVAGGAMYQGKEGFKPRTTTTEKYTEPGYSHSTTTHY